MGNSSLAVRVINHKYTIVVERRKTKMNIVLSNVNFKPNQYACGHETIKTCLDYSYNNHCSSAVLFFLTGGLDFDFLSGEKTLGFNTVEHTVFLLRKFWGNNIFWYGRLQNFEKLEIINRELQKGNILTLYIKAEGLIWQSISEIRYPYHMINVYGIDCEKHLLYISDQFAYDDRKNTIIINCYPWEKIINNTIEIIVYKRNKDLELYNRFDNDIMKELEDFINPTLLHGLNLILLYFEQLESVSDIKYRLNSVTSTRWLIVPIFQHLKDFLVEKRQGVFTTEIDVLIDRWKKTMLKYLKLLFVNEKMNMIKSLEIKNLVESSREVIISINFTYI